LLIIVSFGEGTFFQLAAATFVVGQVAMNNFLAIRTSGFATLYGVQVCLYVTLSLAYMIAVGDQYVFGHGLNKVPDENSSYYESAPYALLFLMIFNIFVYLGLGTGRGKVKQPADLSFISVPSLFVLLLFVAYATYLGISAFCFGGECANKFVDGQSIWAQLYQLIFFDQPFLALVGVYYAHRIATSGRMGSRSLQIQLMLILSVFLCLSVMATSKGGIYVIAMLCFLLPIAYYRNVDNAKVILPSRKLLFLGVIAAPVIFVSAMLLRIARATSREITVTEVFDAGSSVDMFLLIIDSILMRFSATLDRYLLIYHHFITHDWSPAYSSEFLGYLSKSLANLLLPGTPFAEAYSPTSSLFISVLSRSPLATEVSKLEYISSINTQPYTLPGVLIIIAGVFAPLLGFGFAHILVRLSGISANPGLRLSILFLFFGSFTSYAFEASLFYSIVWFVSLTLMLWFLKYASRLYIPLRRPGSSGELLARRPMS
jgi:hypothetical protein